MQLDPHGMDGDGVKHALHFVAVIFGALAILAVAVLSAPWVFYSLGLFALGEDERGIAVFEGAPLFRWLDRGLGLRA